jgi:Leucine-rich repeat (LRR) protein
MITGELPMDMGNLDNLNYCYFYHNDLTGTLPATLGNLQKMELFSLGDNHLTGPIPMGISNMTKMYRLLLQNNLLSGKVLDGVFAEDMTLLEIVDVSNNKLSGSVPKNIFSLPRATTIALSLNCFRGDLPEEMCSVQELQVLSMDGLGAATGCKHEFVIPITGVSLFNTLDGSIPPCLWNLKNLTTLHLSCNGLAGSLQESHSRYESSIRDLSLGKQYILFLCVCLLYQSVNHLI